MDVDCLANFLLVRDRDFEDRCLRDLHDRFIDCVVAFFLDAELILAGGQTGEKAAPGEVSLAVDRGHLRGLQGDAGGGDGDSIFVDDRDGGRGDRLRRSSANQSDYEDQSTHAVRVILRSFGLRNFFSFLKTPVRVAWFEPPGVLLRC